MNFAQGDNLNVVLLRPGHFARYFLYASIYIYIYAYIYVYIYIYTHTHTCISICLSTYVNMYTLHRVTTYMSCSCAQETLRSTSATVFVCVC